MRLVAGFAMNLLVKTRRRCGIVGGLLVGCLLRGELREGCDEQDAHDADRTAERGDASAARRPAAGPGTGTTVHGFPPQARMLSHWARGMPQLANRHGLKSLGIAQL